MSSQSVRTKLYFIESYNFASQHQNAIRHKKENALFIEESNYRKNNLRNLEKNEGQLFLCNGFLTAALFRSNALTFARKAIKQTHLVAVCLEIECKSKDFNKNIIFTDLDEFNEFSN